VVVEEPGLQPATKAANDKTDAVTRKRRIATSRGERPHQLPVLPDVLLVYWCEYRRQPINLKLWRV
jgi:hypothetical protein